METFSVYEIGKSGMVPEPNLKAYLRRGLVRRSLEVERGNRIEERFSREDIYCLRLFTELAGMGLSQVKANRIAYGTPSGIDQPINFNCIEEGYHYLTVQLNTIGEQQRLGFLKPISKVPPATLMIQVVRVRKTLPKQLNSPGLIVIDLRSIKDAVDKIFEIKEVSGGDSRT